MLPFLVTAQTVPSKNYSTLEGLSNNAIKSLFLDSRGLLWIGTENGVSLLQSGKISNFYESDGLAFNSCWAINEDQNGNIWFGSYGGGISKFDGSKFIPIGIPKGLSDGRIRHFFPYKNKIFIGTENGLSIIDIDTHQVIGIQESTSDNTQSYISGFFLHKNYLYYGTYGIGVYRLNPDEEYPKIEKISDHKLIYAMAKMENVVFASNKGFLDVFSTPEQLIAGEGKKSIGQSVIWDTAQDKHRNTYLAAWGIFTQDGGIFRLKDGKIEDLSEGFDISSKEILALAYDSIDHELYVGTQDKGLYEIQLEPGIGYEQFGGKEVLGFAFVEGKKIILHHRGLTFFDNKGNIEKELEKDIFKKSSSEYVGKNRHNLPLHEDDFFEMDFDIQASQIVFYDLQLQGKHLWVNSNIGIYQLDLEGNILIYIPVHSYEIGFTPDGKLIETNPYGGVRIYEDPAKMEYRYYSPSDQNTPVQVSKIIQNGDKTYFSSVFKGIYHYDKNEFLSYLASSIWKEEKFKQIHFSSSGQLVIASEFDEVFIADSYPEFKIKEIIPKEKLVGKNVLFLESYADNIFIGTEKGLNVYRNGIIRFFDEEQGLHKKLFKTAKVNGNHLFIGTYEGYYQLDLPNLLREYLPQLDLKVSEIRVNQQKMDKEEFSWFAYQSNSLELAHNQNTVMLGFLVTGHQFPNKLQYRYRLTPNEEWSASQSENTIVLPYLKAGVFPIEVEVYDLHSGKSAIYPLLRLQIHPPFYLEIWFLLLTFIVLSCFVYWLIRLRIQRTRKEATLKQRLAETKLQALISQMNPHFIFNAINSIQYFVLKNDTDSAIRFLGGFSKLMRTTLDNSTKSFIRLSEEIQYLKSYMDIENERIGNRITCQITFDQSINPESVEVPPMLFQPLVENVFVHAFDSKHPNPTLHVHFQMAGDNLLSAEITDNGRGILDGNQKQFHESKGMKLVRERISLIYFGEGDPVQVDSQKDNGTRIRLLFPFKQTN